MDWPALSPDLSPIEHLIEGRIHRRHVLPATVQELTDAIPRMFIRNLFRPMGRRCAAVIDNDGRHTRY